MPRPASASAPEMCLRQGIQETHAVNDRINQLLLEHLDPRAWRAQLPGSNGRGSKGRTIAAIFTHIHNIRLKWLRLSAPHLKPPPRLDRTRCTQQQAMLALAESAVLCSQMLAEALAPGGRVKKFHRDGWARPWPPGAAMFAYMITHEAHHRGQVCMLAHQLGFKLPDKATSEMWGWERLWKECGFGLPK
ncbi:MAG: DinB family protein [Candidatus Sulfotelmatobacter sp.]